MKRKDPEMFTFDIENKVTEKSPDKAISQLLADMTVAATVSAEKVFLRDEHKLTNLQSIHIWTFVDLILPLQLYKLTLDFEKRKFLFLVLLVTSLMRSQKFHQVCCLSPTVVLEKRMNSVSLFSIMPDIEPQYSNIVRVSSPCIFNFLWMAPYFA